MFISINPSLYQLGEIEAKQAISEVVSKRLSSNKIVIEKSSNGYDINAINYELSQVLKEISLIFNDEYTDYSTYHIPIGSLINNPLFIDMGPRIPIKVRLVGDVMGKIKSEVKEYGLNNALVTIALEINVNVVLIAPLQTNVIRITQEYPLLIDIFEGQVPSIIPTFDIE